MTSPDTRRSAPVTGLVAVAVLLAAVAGGVLLTRGGGGPADGPAGGTDRDSAATSAAPDPSPRPGLDSTEAARAAAASRALFHLEAAVVAEDESAFDRMFADTPRSEAAADEIFTSLRRLPLSTYSLRYVTEVTTAVQAAQRPVTQGPVWHADVEVQWGLRGVDRRAVTTEIRVSFTSAGERARIVAMEPRDGNHAPVWLLGRLQTERVGRALVISLQPPLTEQVASQTRRAVRDVHAVLEGWPGGLVVVLPRSTEQLERLLSAVPGSYDTIAAVTASADGGSDPTAPVRVVLNPPVFTGLGPVAGQVVLSHEATHAATGATFRDMPLWLVEGFADYVALAGDPVPVQVAAGQALERVRRSGPPRRLPSAGDFATSAHGLGASYEAAWLACRLIAEQHGQDGLLRFYQRVARTGDVDAAFGAVLGTDLSGFTAEWRAYLRELA